MNVSTINLRKEKKKTIIAALLSNNFDKPTSREKQEIQRKISMAIRSMDYVVARNTLIIGLFFDIDKTFSNLRKNGSLRYSSYKSSQCIVKELAFEIIEVCSTFGYSNIIDINYLNSIVNLHPLHATFVEIDALIKKEFKFFTKKYIGKSLIKTLLSYVDFLFLSEYQPKPFIDPGDIRSRSKEEISSAVSFLIFLASKYSPNLFKDTTRVAEEYVENHRINKIILAACINHDFKEFEIMIEHFNYQCINKDNKLKIIPPSEDIEKSIKAGYIRTDMQFFNDFYIMEDAGSIKTLAEKLNESNKLDFFKLVHTNNYTRYILEIPEPAIDIIINEFLKPNLLFQEEITYLSHIFKEQLLDFSNLNSIKLKDNLTLMEFIKIKRVFYLLYLLFAIPIIKNEKAEISTILRSLIPVYPEQLFYMLFKKITTQENINSFLDIVCWEPDLDVFFDLQYHPILFIEQHFLVPLSILVHSNSIRNVFASEHKQNNKNLLTDGSDDRLVKHLAHAFNKINIKAFETTAIPNSDIDLFVAYEDTLFLFECKQSLHPTNAFDLRTTYDYIKKAEKQLDHLNDLFNKGLLLKLLEDKKNISLKNIKQVVSGIVLSNRLFNGNAFKYPVRNIHEIENILLRGTMKTFEGNFWIWEKDEISINDLVLFFGKNNEILNNYFNSLSMRTIEYEFSQPHIEFDLYYLDIEKGRNDLSKITSNMRKVEA